ncbi:MAG: hypothetical protein K0S07_1418 [Chlamydiales bacterium]|nr:hypothetical protein [Chlamydiales bacterium]
MHSLYSCYSNPVPHHSFIHDIPPAQNTYSDLSNGGGAFGKIVAIIQPPSFFPASPKFDSGASGYFKPSLEGALLSAEEQKLLTALNVYSKAIHIFCAINEFLEKSQDPAAFSCIFVEGKKVQSLKIIHPHLAGLKDSVSLSAVPEQLLNLYFALIKRRGLSMAPTFDHLSFLKDSERTGFQRSQAIHPWQSCLKLLCPHGLNLMESLNRAMQDLDFLPPMQGPLLVEPGKKISPALVFNGIHFPFFSYLATLLEIKEVQPILAKLLLKSLIRKASSQREDWHQLFIYNMENSLLFYQALGTWSATIENGFWHNLCSIISNSSFLELHLHAAAGTWPEQGYQLSGLMQKFECVFLRPGSQQGLSRPWLKTLLLEPRLTKDDPLVVRLREEAVQMYPRLGPMQQVLISAMALYQQYLEEKECDQRLKAIWYFRMQILYRIAFGLETVDKVCWQKNLLTGELQGLNEGPIDLLSFYEKGAEAFLREAFLSSNLEMDDPLIKSALAAVSFYESAIEVPNRDDPSLKKEESSENSVPFLIFSSYVPI